MKRGFQYQVAVWTLVVLVGVPGLMAAQTSPAAKRSDVESIDAIMSAVYDVISGPAGQERDWDRFRSLFRDGAQLMPTGPDSTGAVTVRRLPVPDYIDRSGPFLVQRGFFEREVHRVTEQFGNIAHAFSTYESRWNADDPEPFVRGINSFQLLFDGSRWWVVNIFWGDERGGHQIPAKYLP